MATLRNPGGASQAITRRLKLALGGFALAVTALAVSPMSASAQLTITRPINTPPPPVHQQGSQRLLAASMMDLDSGALNGPGADIRYQLVGNTLVPINGTVMAVRQNAGGTIFDCINLNYASTPIPVGNLPASAAICYSTSEGRVGELRIGNVGITLEINYITWER